MEIFTAKPLKPIWLKASVVGSIWASVEIILGSFLHNLRIPVTGMIMSFVSVWLLITFMGIWKEKGLIWRAGLICALMKSISPSAIILGPMIGILSEALLLELFILLAGRNLIAYMIGGALAVLSTLVQKIVSLLITYGLDLVRLAEDLYRFAVKQIRLEQLSPGTLIIIIICLYILTGITAAILGYNSGRKFLNSEKERDPGKAVELKPGTGALFQHTTGHDYSLVLLILNIMVIAGILVLLNFNLILPALALSVIYVSFCIFQYKNALRRLRKVSFWIIFLLITFTATFLWDRVSNGVFFSMEGLVTGLKMNARAVVMVLGFASISVELKNPLIKSVLYNRGFASLYQSLGLSFSALPFIVSNFSLSGKKVISESVKHSKGLLHQADYLYKLFEREDNKRPVVVIITGALHEGKTTFALKVADSLREKGFRPGGFLAIAVNEEGKRSGFILKDLSSGREAELCSNKPDPERVNYGHFYFNREILKAGEQILKPEELSDKQTVFIDEIGPLELKGQGWSRAIDTLCQSNTILQVWIVREGIVHEVLKKWSVGHAYIFNIRKDDPGTVTTRIISLVKDSTINRAPSQ